METNPSYCTRTGRTTSEKTMEDGNLINTKDEKTATASLSNLYSERSYKVRTNGHDIGGEPSISHDRPLEHRRHSADTQQEDKFGKRINPLRIHLGKRPFVDNSVPYNSVNKKKKPFVIKPCETSVPKNNPPRVPKLIPKRLDHSQFHNAAAQVDNTADNEHDKPVPRLVPKSQLSQFNKSKVEKGNQLKEYAQSLGLQPMVKFKCRKCSSMSFKTLAMLKEHQLVCRAQAKEPALSPEAAPSTECNTGGPSRVTRKVYLCSACGTYYENWNLFLHMREVHNRHICLFCLGMFSKAEKLSTHLINKHNVQEFNYDSKDEFCKVYNGTFYLMCCVCDEICSEKDDFFNHDCNNVKPKPVPVLISKNSMKTNNSKFSKVGMEATTNGPSAVLRDMLKPVVDKRDMDSKPETVTSLSQRYDVNDSYDTNITDVSFSSSVETTDKDTSSTVDTTNCLNSSVSKSTSPIVDHTSHSTESNSNSIPNGNETMEQSDDSDSHDTSDHGEPETEYTPLQQRDPSPPPPKTPEKEKECGIKLKLSLNNANSPVIINSTVDPTVGQQYAHKPPSRNRRPPKRYEKDKPPDPAPLVKPPSIKMTICDKADSPFVKTTFIENDKETTLKTLVNNNVDTLNTTTEFKSENMIKSTIYDNKLDEINTMNRVPKLTVRVPKEFLDKDSSSDYSSDSDSGEKLNIMDSHEQETSQTYEENKEEPPDHPQQTAVEFQAPQQDETEPEVKENAEVIENKVQIKDEGDLKTEPKEEPAVDTSTEDINVEEDPADPAVTDDIPITELTLDRPIDKYPLKDLLKVFLASTVVNCIYCNHVRKIAVNCEQLALHMVAEHRFSATVDSITAEELMPSTITAKVKAGAEELGSIYINLDSYDSVDKCETVQHVQMFECFQCYFKTAVHKDLYLHNRKLHQKTILLCVMCKNNFYSYSELLCHLCPGTYDSEYEIKFRCCFCNVDNISSSFRLMVHLRKIHHTCDVCLEFCQSQARLSNHVWKHKLHHLCYRCGLAYRNKPDITNHLFWKHGTESVLCKKCLQKKWPHVYHFCTPPAVFVCDECTLQFTRAVCLKVHKRFHSEEFPHVCTEEGCTEKFVSKKLLNKHLEEHRKKLISEDLTDEKPPTSNECSTDNKETIPVIDLVDEKPNDGTETSECKTEVGTEQSSRKSKKKKNKDKDALLLDVNLPALNLSESDSSDESDSGISQPNKDETSQDKLKDEPREEKSDVVNNDVNAINAEVAITKVEEKDEIAADDKPSEQQVLDIWDNFKKYQAKVEKQKEKTPPLVPIRKHVCESDHDYCLIPTELNGEDDSFNSDKKKNRKSPKKRHGDLSSSSSSSSDSDSSCSCGSNCSCSSSSGSSSSSSSDSDSSDESGNEKKKIKTQKKSLQTRRISNGSNVDVMGMSETPILIPEKTEPPIAESDLETEESETDEEFYDKHPQQVANKMHNEKRNQLMLLASVAPSDGGSLSGEVGRSNTPIKEEETKVTVQEKQPEEKEVKEDAEIKEKTSSSKKKSKKKKKSKSSRKHGPLKMTIPKDIIAKAECETPPPPLIPNKITISLQSNTVQLPEAPPTAVAPTPPAGASTLIPSTESKRASKRRRVPNKFYGYSSDEEAPPNVAALKPQQPPKLEWRKEDLPSPVTHKSKKEIPSTVIPQRMFNYNEPIRLTAPIPDPEPPRFLMNSESMESSDSESSNDGGLEIYQQNNVSNSIPVPPPTYLNSGTSSLPYAFQRPAVRQAREGESVYCYCRCPYDEVSEMIACDADGCTIEWFHFECVGIMVPPKGKWYCPECRKNPSFAGYR